MTDLWTHIGFARLAAFVGERAGLRFAPNRQPAAEAAIRRVMRDVGEGDPLDFARRVETDATLLAAVLAEVTIGETYFFREPGQLEFIRTQVLPTLRATHSAAKPLRVWSAGCASGEEPYTLAIMLREAGLGAAARILGTDLSRPRIAAAERGRYTQWSLRGVAEPVVARYFIRRGKQFLLRPEIRAMVEFRPLNLATDDYPGPRSGIGNMDLILCRNVLIYFDRQTVATVAGRLLASLGDDGWLFLGASDPMLAELVPCETVVTGAGLAYRKVGAARPGVVAGRWWTGGLPAATADDHARAEAAGRLTAGDPFAALNGTPAPGEGATGVASSAMEDAARGAPPEMHDAAAGGAEHHHSDAGGRAAAGPGARGAPPTGKIARRVPGRATERPPAASPGRAATGGGDARTEPGARPAHQRRYDERDYAAAASLAADAVARDPRDAAAWAVLVRALANAGRVDEAERACTTALERRPDDAPLAYLHAVLLSRRGQFAAAAAAARRAVYLDRGLAVAQITLGSALARVGERDQARRAFRAAERILDRLDADAAVPLADGETARRLAEAARAHRRRLDEPAA